MIRHNPGVILFRAQPLHKGHIHMIRLAYRDCALNDTDLYIIVGSADKFRTKRNPIPINYRMELLNCALVKEFNGTARERIHVMALEDLSDEANNTLEWGQYLLENIALFAHSDRFTFYYSDNPSIMLSWFDSKQREYINFKFLDRHEGISATKVRQAILDEDKTAIDEMLPWYYNDTIISTIRRYLLEAK